MQLLCVLAATNCPPMCAVPGMCGPCRAAQAQLVAGQVALLAGLSGSEAPSAVRQLGMWGTLMADVLPGRAAAPARQLLLGAFRCDGRTREFEGGRGGQHGAALATACNARAYAAVFVVWWCLPAGGWTLRAAALMHSGPCGAGGWDAARAALPSAASVVFTPTPPTPPGVRRPQLITRASAHPARRETLSSSNRQQLSALLRSLELHLAPPAPGHGAGGQLPVLQCLLVSLESLGGPRVTKLLAGQGPSLVGALTRLLAASALWGGGRTAAAAAAHEAALCTALRCLGSILGRPKTFQLAPTHVTAALAAVLTLADGPLAPRPQGHGQGQGQGQPMYYGLHAASSGLTAVVVRHHTAAAGHCMALVVDVARALLLAAAAAAAQLRRAQRRQGAPQVEQAGGGGLSTVASALSSVHVHAQEEGLVRAAAGLARLYDAVADEASTLGRQYGIHLLADYVIHAATPLPSTAPLAAAAADEAADPWGGAGHLPLGELPAAGHDGDDGALVSAAAGAGANGGGGGPPTLLPAEGHRALRLAAYRLLGCLGPAQLQHLHMALGVGATAGQVAARRGALAQLRKGYESEYKYSGKV